MGNGDRQGTPTSSPGRSKTGPLHGTPEADPSPGMEPKQGLGQPRGFLKFVPAGFSLEVFMSSHARLLGFVEAYGKAYP